MYKKLFTHTAIYGLAPQMVRLAQIFVLPIITPFLTAEDYGVFGLISAVIGAVSAFSTMGMSIVLSNSFFKSPNHYKWLWRQIYGFLTYWSILYSIIVSILILFFIPVEAKDNTLIIVLLNVLPLVIFGPIGTIGPLYYQLKQQPAQIMIRSVIVGFLTLALNIYFIKYLRLGYLGWFAAAAISQVLINFTYYISLNLKVKITPIFNFKWRTIKNQLKVTLPIIPHYYSSYFIGAFDRVIMKFYGVDTGEIGKYNIATTPASLVGSGTYALNQAISPLLLQSYKEKDYQQERKLNFVSIIVVLAACSLLCLFVKELLPMLIKTEGVESIFPLSILFIMSNAQRPMYVAANNRLFYLEKTKALLKVTTVAAIISVVLNVLGIGLFGFKAAAFVLFICNMYIGYSGFFIKEYKEQEVANHFPLFWLILTCLLTLLFYFIAAGSLYLRVILAIGISVFSLLGLFVVHKKI